MKRYLQSSWALLLAACASSGSQPEAPATKPRVAQVRPQAVDAPAGLAALSARLVGALPAGTLGPYVASSGASRIAVWAAVEPQGKVWYSIDLASGGPPLRLGQAPEELALVAVRPMGWQSEAGFAVLATRSQSRALDVSLLGPTGALVAGPVAIAEARGRVLWVDAVPTAAGAMLCWAESEGGAAKIRTRVVRSDGKLAGDSQLVHGQALGWQLRRTANGAALAVVSGTGKLGQPELIFINPNGTKAANAVTVDPSATARPNIDMVPLGSRLLVAWTDERGADSRVRRALVALDGSLDPRDGELLDAGGDQALLRLVEARQSGMPAYVAWQLVDDPAVEQGEVRLATVGESGRVAGAQGSLRVWAPLGRLPELSAAERGLAALTVAPPCARSATCPDAAIVPFFVQFDGEFNVAAAEPFRLEPLAGQAATLGWGLDCGAAHCRALAAAAGDAPPVYDAVLAPRTSHWQAPGGPRESAPGAALLDRVSLRRVEALADLDVARVGGQELMAWITYFDPSRPYERPDRPAPDGRFAPIRARLQLSRADSAAGEPTQISLRARSLGGLDLASGDGQALLAWSAIDDGKPEVFATLLGEDGSKTLQRMLTHNGSEIFDVAATRVSHGWLVGWIDERHENPEVYVARLGERLDRLGPERRIARSSGSASGLTFLSEGDRVLAVWINGGGAGATARSELYAALLEPRTGQPRSEPRKLSEARARLRAPAAVSADGGWAVAWLEEPGPDAEPPQHSAVHFGRLDAGGRWTSPPQRLELQGVATDIALECRGAHCRGVLSVEASERTALRVIDWRDASAPELSSGVVGVAGPPARSPLLRVQGSRAYWSDVAPGSGTRLRRATLFE